MLQCGFSSFQELMDSTIPDSIRMKRKLSIGDPQGEQETLAQLKDMLSTNKVHTHASSAAAKHAVIRVRVLR